MHTHEHSNTLASNIRYLYLKMYTVYRHRLHKQVPIPIPEELNLFQCKVPARCSFLQFQHESFVTVGEILLFVLQHFSRKVTMMARILQNRRLSAAVSYVFSWLARFLSFFLLFGIFRNIRFVRGPKQRTRSTMYS